MYKRGLTLIALMGILLSIMGCSATAAHQNRTGFLHSYENLENEQIQSFFFFEIMPDANLSVYTKILIPDIKVIAGTQSSTAKENELYIQTSAYATAAYRKNIIKNSANYTVVDVAQKDTIIMQIALSMVEVHPDDSSWDNLTSLPFSLTSNSYTSYAEGNVRLLVEAKISDAMDNRLLAHSMRIIMDEEISLHDGNKLQFIDFQKALDTWLNKALVKR